MNTECEPCACSEFRVTSMELTSDQKHLEEVFAQFLKSDERVLMIRGYAGTGKTYMIGRFATMLRQQRRQVALIAPTGRAARVLQEKSGIPAATIHRAIYDLAEVIVHEDEPGLFKYLFKTKESASDNLDTVVIADEASLISDHRNESEFLRFGSGRLLSDLIRFLRLDSSESRSKLVLVGDPAQLAPVGSEHSPALDPTYWHGQFHLEPTTVELTEVVRQAKKSAILEQATTIRESIRAERFNQLVISEAPPEIASASLSEMVDLYAAVIRENPERKAICIAFSNARCLGLNISLRARLFGGDGRQPVVAGDWLMVIRNNLVTGLVNGDLVRVESTSDTTVTREIKVGEERVLLHFRPVQMSMEVGSEALLHDVYILENALQSPLRDIAPIEQKALFVDFILRHSHLKPRSKEFSEALRSDPFFNSIQVKFGYAITCHKAQGGEWDQVFVLFENSQTDLNSLRWAYTALTRARVQITGVGLPNKQPWEKVLSVKRPIATSESDEHPEVLEQDSADATRWDKDFGSASLELLRSHRHIVKAVLAASAEIANVNVRLANYFWRYEIKRGEQVAMVQVNFNKKSETTVNIVPSAGSNESFSREIVRVIQGAINLGAIAVPDTVYSSNHEFLEQFYSKVVQQTLMDAGARLLRVEHLPYRERLHIGREIDVAVLDIIYNGKGEITGFVQVRGSDELGHELLQAR